MNSALAPLKTDSRKDVFVSRFEHLILSGEFSTSSISLFT